MSKPRKKRKRDKAKQAACAKAWREKNRAKCAESTRRWAAQNPNKRAAKIKRRAVRAKTDPLARVKYRCRMKTRWAVACGRILKMPCAVCSNPKSEVHHVDYYEPFAVLWLCKIHHRQFHFALGTGHAATGKHKAKHN